MKYVVFENKLIGRNLSHTHLKEPMLVQFSAILEPVDLGPWQSSGLAEERDLPAQHVVELKVACFDYFRSILMVVVVHCGWGPLLDGRMQSSSMPTLISTTTSC